MDVRYYLVDGVVHEWDNPYMNPTGEEVFITDARVQVFILKKRVDYLEYLISSVWSEVFGAP